VDTVNDTGVTPLMAAAQEDHVQTVRLLINLEADREKREQESGCTALIITAASGNTKALVELLTRGARLEAKSFVSKNPLLKNACTLFGIHVFEGRGNCLDFSSEEWTV